jgi:hypothetical protein
MTDQRKEITEEEARAIAETRAARSFRNEKPPLLDRDCTTGKNGWIFYLRPDVKLTPTSWHVTYCVTRKGEQLMGWDERDQPGKMQEIADTMVGLRERLGLLDDKPASAKEGE